MNGAAALLYALVATVVGCAAFSPSKRHRHHRCTCRCTHLIQRRDAWHRSMRPQLPLRWPSPSLFCNVEEGHEGELLSIVGGSMQAVSATAAASFVVVGAAVIAVPLVARAEAPSFSILQQHQQRERVAALPGNPIETAFQGFVRKGTAPTASRTIRTIQLPRLLSSEQGSTAPTEPQNIDAATKKEVLPPTQQPTETPTAPPKACTEKQPPIQGNLQASDVKKIAEENKIDVELICKDPTRPLDVPAPPAVVKIDRDTFSKVKVVQPPFLQYLPSSVQPLVSRQFQSLRVLKSIPNDQLFIASVFAGSLTEMIRTSVLYPLSTVKARVQARTARRTNRDRPLLRKLRVTWLSFLYEAKRGDWYAGLLPTLLITTPASGVYSGAKEVSRRAFSMAIQVELVQNLFPGDAAAQSYYSALAANLLAAFVADIASSIIRTPADVLALRLQVFGKSNVKSDYSAWLKDSAAILPAMVLTDIPFLLSRIFLNAAITTSGENLGSYEVETIAIACLCAFLTTPFDVARTRILLPTLQSDEDAEESGILRKRRRLIASSKNRKERRQQVSVAVTMKRIAAEGNGGVQNLYAGWFERTAYLGIGRAWLDPLRVIGYLGIRDALLLKLFD
ncbi:hypothetical protein ACHAWF_019047 [Thalassiosira exigua]